MFRKNFKYFLFGFVCLMVATTTFIVSTFVPFGKNFSEVNPSDNKIETASTPNEELDKKNEENDNVVVATKKIKIDETKFPKNGETPTISAVLAEMEIDLATVKVLEIVVGKDFLGKTLFIDKIDCVNLEELLIYYDEPELVAEYEREDYEKLFIIEPLAFSSCKKINKIDIDINSFSSDFLDEKIFEGNPITKVLFSGEGTLTKDNLEILGLDKEVSISFTFIGADYEEGVFEEYPNWK